MRTKKTLLFVVEAMGGGIFSYIVSLANQLVNIYDIHIAYAVRRQTPKNFQEYFDTNIHLIEVENFSRSINPVKDFKAFFEIRRIAKEIDADIIHLHSSKAGILGRWAYNGKKIPLFYTPHGYSFLMTNYGFIKRMFFRFMEWISSKRNCTVICCSKGEFQECLKLTKNATFINNGIDTYEIDEIVKGEMPKEHPFTVFTLGRICHQKNPKLFNDIALKLPIVKFVWIGDGELRNVLVAPNIEIVGWLERDDALKKSINTDIFILTSLWEGLPISLLEAMYMKKVCVVSNVIGNKDVINNNNGFVCDDVDDFVDAIKIIMENNTGDIIKNAYDDITNEYNINTMVKSYIEVYEKHSFNFGGE